jgi:hypothetical protein
MKRRRRTMMIVAVVPLPIYSHHPSVLLLTTTTTRRRRRMIRSVGYVVQRMIDGIFVVGVVVRYCYFVVWIIMDLTFGVMSSSKK